MSNTLRESQEVTEITPELRVIMEDLGLPAQSLGIGISKGYEARIIDDSLPAVAGNVIWAHKRHLDSFQAYLDSEVAGAFEDGARSAQKPSPPPEGLYTKAHVQQMIEDAVVTALKERQHHKGKAAYLARTTGKDWAEIGPNSLNNAKAYAKKNGLPWPVKIN